MTFQFGIDQLLLDEVAVKQLQTRRVALVAHPGSVTAANQHSIDALIAAGCNLVRAFGPQHGLRGDRQDNMQESEDYVDARHQLPVLSLYAKDRYPTPAMLEDLDVVLFDLQDIGCRIYTYITTLCYLVMACRDAGVELWVLDRPNPAGRPIDGLYLEAGEESFVGCAAIPVRHGLTTGELAGFFQAQLTGLAGPDEGLRVIKMAGYEPDSAPGYGWPVLRRPWINPSPNASSVNMARCFPGTVLLEGTNLSEGRGTSTPLEVIGAPDLNLHALLLETPEIKAWAAGVWLRECFFSPSFHKHAGQLCTGIQWHTDYPGYAHQDFKPYRLMAAMLKLIRMHQQDYPLWRDHAYEYEFERLPIDVINGGASLREWVDGPSASFDDLNKTLQQVESQWQAERAGLLLY